MIYTDFFFSAIQIDPKNRSAISRFSKASGVPISRLDYYNEKNIVPSGSDLRNICSVSGISRAELMIKMGRIDHELKKILHDHANGITALIEQTNGKKQKGQHKSPELAFKTKLGRLYKGDCLSLMRTLEDESIDLIFADPPFNLSKLYPSNIDDDLKERQYLEWCESWLSESIRLLKMGGSLFVWNLPKWNTYLSEYLNGFLTFRHWIAVDIKYRLPIAGRLYPSHYSLLYYCKGDKPKTFHPDRLPMKVCSNCYADLTDYGGYKNKMNPLGINLSDVWYDIPPVRHSKYKKRKNGNELSIRLLDRIIEMSSDPGDLIFDPFGGSGTTYAVAEIKKRRWLGIELGPTKDISNRFADLDTEADRLNEMRVKLNCLFTEDTLRERNKRKLWNHETVKKNGKNKK